MTTVPMPDTGGRTASVGECCRPARPSHLDAVPEAPVFHGPRGRSCFPHGDRTVLGRSAFLGLLGEAAG